MQDRIRLPRRPLAPDDLRSGDRAQIGQEVWRVAERRPRSPSGRIVYLLTAVRASAATALLTSPGPPQDNHLQRWTLTRDGEHIAIPGRMIVLFPSGSVDDPDG
jgi:hypothetical protein